MNYFILGFLILGIVSSIAMVCYIAFLESSKVQTIGLLLTVSCTIVFIGYFLECIATSRDQAIMAIKIGYLGKPISMFLFFLFLVYYCRIKLPKWLSIIFIAAQFFITGLVLTCDMHTLYYSSISELDTNKFYGKLTLGHGPFYYFNIFMCLLYFVLEVILFIKEYKLSKTKIEKVQLFLMIIAIFFTLFGFAAFLLFDTNGFDTTIAGCFFSMITFFILLVKYKVFDTVSLAKDTSLDKSESGLAVFDHRGKLVYINNSAKEVIINVDDIKDSKVDTLLNYFKENKNFEYNGKIYRVKIRNIEKQNVNYGKTVEFHDVTKEINYSQELEKDVEKRTKEIVDIQRQIIKTFANLLEAKDEGTGTHIKETELHVKEIVNALIEEGLYVDYLNKYGETIINAAPLHDIGKFSIPDRILLKPEKLTDEEFDIIKTHSTVGGNIIEENLRNVETEEYVNIAKNIALYHHERWDGKGYPTGIKEDEIPLEARIMAIADVYNALTSKRCYKEAFTKEKAIDIMISEKGTHFDPVLLDVFLKTIA